MYFKIAFGIVGFLVILFKMLNTWKLLDLEKPRLYCKFFDTKGFNIILNDHSKAKNLRVKKIVRDKKELPYSIIKEDVNFLYHIVVPDIYEGDKSNLIIKTNYGKVNLSFN